MKNPKVNSAVSWQNLDAKLSLSNKKLLGRTQTENFTLIVAVNKGKFLIPESLSIVEKKIISEELANGPFAPKFSQIAKVKNTC